MVDEWNDSSSLWKIWQEVNCVRRKERFAQRCGYRAFCSSSAFNKCR